MTAIDVLVMAKKKGVYLYLKDEKLAFKASKGALDKELRHLVGAHKAAIVSLLRESSVKTEIIPKRSADSRVPLTKSQQRMFFISQLSPESFSYNICIGLMLNGEIDLTRFCRDIETVISQHSILNSTVNVEDDNAFLTYQSTMKPMVLVEECGNVQSENLSDIQRLLFKKNYHRHIDLQNGPIVFCNLYSYSPNETLFFFKTHHLFMDGLSFEILANEIIAEYFGTDKPSKNANDISFEDFAVWQSLENIENPAHERYWCERLKDSPPCHSLPLDRERSQEGQGKGSFYKPTLPADLVNQLKNSAAQLDVSLFSLMHTCFSLVISIWSRQDDIVTGVPVSGREHRQLQSIVGMLANTLVYRAKFDFSQSFKDVVKHQHMHHIDALSHQNVSLERLVELFNPSRDANHTPLFQLFFNLVAIDEPYKNATSLAYSHIELDTFEVDAKFDLSLNILDQQSLSFCWDFDQDIFDLQTIKDFHKSLISLLEIVTSTPDILLSDITLVSNGTKNIEPNSSYNFINLFVQQCNSRGESIAIVSGDTMTTYNALFKKVAGIAKAVNQQCNDQPVAIIGQIGIDFICAMLACITSGKTYVPIDSSLPEERRKNIFNQANIKTVIHCSSDTIASGSSDINASTVPDTSELKQLSHGENPAYIIFTSGSTGRPKGVAIDSKNLSAFFGAMTKRIGFTSKDSIFALTTPSFDISLVELILPLINGGKVILSKPEFNADGPALCRIINEHSPSYIQATPATWQLLINEQNLNLAYTSALVGGEAVPITLAKSLVNRASKVWNCYGPTETTVWSMVNEITTDRVNSSGVLIGGTLDGYQHQVVDRFNNVLPCGAIGELAIGGAGVGAGYWHEIDKTTDVFRQDIVKGQCWYKTGDLVQQIAGDEYRYLGRIDHQVKIRGYRIELTDIEHHLQRIVGENIKCIVAAKANSADFLDLVGYVRCENVDYSSIEQQLNNVLPHYMVPKIWVTIKEIPLNSNGKVDRNLLPNANNSTPSFAKLESTVEKKIHQVWLSLLPHEQIGADDNFFSLGGNSLIINKMLSGIKKVTGKQISLAQVFKFPTIRQLANVIEGDKGQVNIIKRPSKNASLMSSSQLRIWLSEGISAPASNHIPMALRLTGELHVDLLRSALKEVANKHSALRIYFEEIQGVIQQNIIHKNDLLLPFSTVDYHHENRLESQLTDDFNTFVELPFFLDNAPLFRIQLVILSDTEYALFSVFHHIIFDGWSFGIFLNDMIQAYQALLNDQDIGLIQPKLDYLDFSNWQQSWLTSDACEKQKSFWQSYLNAAPRETRLIPDKVLREKTSEPARLTTNISADLMLGIRLLAKQLNTNVFNVLYAGFNLLISELTGQKTVVTGTPVSGRELAETQDMIGMFVNNLAVKVVIDDKQTVSQYIHSHMENLAEVFEHQLLPFESVIDIVNPPRNVDSTPLFQLFFNMLNLPETTNNLEDLTIAPLFSEDVGAKFDLTIYVSELEEHFQLLIIYNGSRYSTYRIETFLSQYIHLLSQFTSDVNKRLCDIELLTSSIETHINNGWNGSVIARFEAQTINFPSHSAILSEKGQLTYSELQQKINVFAGYLQHEMPSNGKVIAICIERSIEAVASILGVLKAGFAFTLIDLQQGIDKVKRQLKKVDPALIVAFESTPHFEDEDILIMDRLPAIEFWQWQYSCDGVNISHEDLACVTYTSGSTGEIKAVLGSHGGLANYLSWFIPHYSINEDDRVPLLSGLTHDPLQRDIFEALCSGATLVIPEENQIKPDTLSGWMIDNQISVAHFTPSQSLLINKVSHKQFFVRHMFFVGELLSTACVERMMNIMPRSQLHNVYGATESQRGLSFTRYFVGNEPSEILMDTPDTSIRIHNRKGKPCVYGQQGELIIWSNNIALGYLHGSEEDNSRFIKDDQGNRGYKTGDIGVTVSNGKIKLLGREDRQIKLRGYRIELAEIEAYIAKVEGVKHVAVCFEPVDTDGYLSAYIAIDESHFDMLDLKRSLRSQMPIYMIPTHWAVMPDLPLNANGKVNYFALNGAQLSGEDSFVSPKSSTETELAGIWQNYLPVDTIGIDNNFFESGGHSLDAASMLAEVKKQSGMDVSLRQVFENPTIRELAILLDALEAKSLLVSMEDNNNIEVIEL